MKVMVTKSVAFVWIQSCPHFIQGYISSIVCLDAVVVRGARERGEGTRVCVTARMAMQLRIPLVGNLGQALTLFLREREEKGNMKKLSYICNIV